MNDPEKYVDLEPQNWQSDREKPHEPFFGDGWPFGLSILVAVVFGALAVQAGFGALGTGGASILGALIGNAAHQLRS